MALQIYNTLNKREEEFIPLEDGHVTSTYVVSQYTMTSIWDMLDQ